MQEQTTTENLLRARQQMIELEETTNNDDTLIGMFKRAAINAIDNHARLISGINNLVIKHDDRQEDLCELKNKSLFFHIIVLS